MIRTFLAVLLVVGALTSACSPEVDSPAASEDPASVRAQGAVQPDSTAAAPDKANGAGGGETTTYTNKALGFSIQHPATSSIRACKPDEGSERAGAEPSNCVALTRRESGRPVAYALLEVFDGALEATAQREAGFEPGPDGVWRTTYGRFEPVPVERFAGPGWNGMQAVVICGSGDENGFHAAGGECLWAVLSDGRRAVVVSSDPEHGQDETLQRSIMSLRLAQGAHR